MGPNPDQSSNGVLSGLAAADLARLKPFLSAVDLPLRKQLEARHRRIEHVYFLTSGIASVVVSGGSNHSVEVGIIGHEGMTGLALLLGADRSPHETFIQSAGEGWRIEAPMLERAMQESPALQRHLLRHVLAFMGQMSFTTLANARYKIDERLARWLLMAADRVGPRISLTHEFLSLMMGTRRPGITSALNVLEKQGLIEARRGIITICDRDRLVEIANGCYGAPEAELDRLFPAH